MIELHKINKNYQTPSGTINALNDINLTVNKGEIFGIVGHSGAGKSTLIHCLNLLEQPTTGKIILNGEELTRLSKKQLRLARRKIGMIFQQFNLLNSRTVWQNIALPMELSHTPKNEIKNKVNSLLALTGLDDKQDYYPSQLSGGQKQRVAIARALANDPQVLLCDEATSALDPETTTSILQLLQKINQQLHLTIVLITHEMDVIKQICQRVALLHNGEIIEQANSRDFFHLPKSDIAKEFIKSSFHYHIPDNTVEQFNGENKRLIRLSFTNKTVNHPIISQISRDFAIDINILQANLEYIQNETMGHMLIVLQGPEEKMNACLQYFDEQALSWEAITHESN